MRALGILGTVGKQANARSSHAAHHARICRAHLGEANDIARFDIGIGTHVGEHREPGAVRDGRGDARTDGPAVAILLIPKRRDVRGCRRRDGAGGTCGEEAIGLPALHRAAGYNDARFALGHDRLDGVVLHADDIGCDERLNPVVRLRERLYKLLRTARKYDQVVIGRQRGIDAVEDHLGLLVSTHNIYDYSNLAHNGSPR